MRGRGKVSPNARWVVLSIVVAGLALGYLVLHNWSFRLSRRVMQLGKERQILVERLDRLDAEVTRLSSFERLESLWVARGMPPAVDPSPSPETVARQDILGHGMSWWMARRPHARPSGHGLEMAARGDR